MPLGKLGEFVPIGNFAAGSMWAIRPSLVVSSFTKPLQPQVDRVATHLEHLSRFAFLHGIQLDRSDDFLT